MNNFDIWDTAMLYFSESSHCLEHFDKAYTKEIIYAKFYLPRLHSIWEKSNPNLQKIQCCKIVEINNFDIWRPYKTIFFESSHCLESFW